jgi:hypothetical protein
MVRLRDERRQHRDQEMAWFYAFVCGIPGCFGLLAVALQQWIPAGALLLIAAGFALVGWPWSATVSLDGSVTFRAPLRWTRVSAGRLRVVRVVWPGEWRCHVVLRCSWGFPVGYRHHQYTDAPGLAAAICRLIQSSTTACVDPRAMALLSELSRGR